MIAGLVLLGVLAFGTTKVEGKEVKEEDNVFYIVQSGDSLSKIADKYDVNFSVVHGNNEDVIDHADLIFTGQKILVGGEDFDENKSKSYEVQQVAEVPVVNDTEQVVQEPSQEVAQEAPQVAAAPATQAVANDGSPLYAATAVANATGTSVDTWLYIIEAESTNNPHVVNSIGCYGYFQIHPVHGMPHGASVDTQIQYAIMIYNSSGFGAWEVM